MNATINSNQQYFRPRSMAKYELAMMYFPDTIMPETATAHLRQWIRRNRELSERLAEMSYTPQSKYFTPRQVAAIVEVLGEP